MRIIVIGAGVLGASTALHLARSGADVVLFEGEFAGRATQAGAGIICPWLSHTGDPDFTALYEGGAAYYPELIPSLGTDHATGYRRCGALFVSPDHEEIAAMQRQLAARTPSSTGLGGVDCLSPHQAQGHFPPLAPDLSALRIEGGARVDGRLLVSALISQAQRLGVALVRRPATLAFHGTRVIGVHSQGELTGSDIVVATNGAWGADLLRPLGIALPIAPQRGQILHLELPGQDTSHWPVVLPNSSHYLLAFDNGRIVAGATRESGMGFDYRVTAAGQAELLGEALRIAPGLAAATLIETRIGFRPAAPSFRPLLGRVSGVEGLVIGNGLGAGGLTIGPYAGRLLAELLMGTPSLDLTPFDPLRADFRTGPVLR